MMQYHSVGRKDAEDQKMHQVIERNSKKNLEIIESMNWRKTWKNSVIESKIGSNITTGIMKTPRINIMHDRGIFNKYDFIDNK